jgi:hypothetical protein
MEIISESVGSLSGKVFVSSFRITLPVHMYATYETDPVWVLKKVRVVRLEGEEVIY